MAYMEAEDIILVMQGMVYGYTLQENKKNCMGTSEGSRQGWIDWYMDALMYGFMDRIENTWVLRKQEDDIFRILL